MVLCITMAAVVPERIQSGCIDSQAILGEDGTYQIDIDPRLASGDTSIPYTQPVIRDVGTSFSLEGFSSPRHPVVVGHGNLDSIPVGTRLESLPIKFPGTGYRVPNELACVRSLLELCATYEARINPSVDEYFAYLSLERTEVNAGQHQRASEIHSDDIQGPRINPKVPVAHGYVMVDRDPTLFFPDPVDVTGVDVDVHNMAAVFDQRVNRSHVVTHAVGTVALIDGYTLHQGCAATATGPRGFFRLMYSTRHYDRSGNSVNTSFEQEYRQVGWEFAPRPRPPLLAPPVAKT